MIDRDAAVVTPTDTDSVPPCALDHAESSPEVAEFCRVHGLSASPARCVELARKHFQLVGKSSIYLSTDPETAEKWLVISVKAAGTLECVSDAYDRFIHEWVRSSDRKSRDKIRFSYTLARP